MSFNIMRRDRGRGGVSLSSSHAQYDEQILHDESIPESAVDRMDGLRPGLKLTIQGRGRLKKCIWAQTIFQLLKASLILWAYTNHERVTHATNAACVFALIAIFSGHNALERQSIGWTKAYILFMAMSTTLVAYPLYKQGGKGSGWSIYKRTAIESNHFPTNFINARYLEGIQDLGSVTVQILGLAAATNLLKHFLASRQDKGVMHMRESSRRSSRDQRL